MRTTNDGEESAISDGLRRWAYWSFKGVGCDLAVIAKEQPQLMPQIDVMVRAWDAYTAGGADFGSAAVLVMKDIERINKE